jgi:hypothetical protein
VKSRIVERAQAVAEERLASLTTRLAHVRGVAIAAERATSLVNSEEAETLVAAAWLHDVGYAPSVRSTGFHPVDGALFVHALGFPEMVVSLVAYHTGAVVEAAERGLETALGEFSPPASELLDALTYADMTTGPDGNPVDADERLAEILTRYESDDPVHRAVTRSLPELLAAVERTQQRLTSAGVLRPR